MTNHHRGGRKILTSQEKADQICRALEDEKAIEVVLLDVQGLTLLADYFIICTGTSTTHLQAISEGVQETLKEDFGLRTKSEGAGQSNWIVLDYGDVVVHIFSEERRNFYDLERLWSDAPRRKESAPTQATAAPA